MADGESHSNLAKVLQILPKTPVPLACSICATCQSKRSAVQPTQALGGCAGKRPPDQRTQSCEAPCGGVLPFVANVHTQSKSLLHAGCASLTSMLQPASPQQHESAKSIKVLDLQHGINLRNLPTLWNWLVLSASQNFQMDLVLVERNQKGAQGFIQCISKYATLAGKQTCSTSASLGRSATELSLITTSSALSSISSAVNPAGHFMRHSMLTAPT